MDKSKEFEPALEKIVEIMQARDKRIRREAKNEALEEAAEMTLDLAARVSSVHTSQVLYNLATTIRFMKETP